MVKITAEGKMNVKSMIKKKQKKKHPKNNGSTQENLKTTDVTNGVNRQFHIPVVITNPNGER